MKQVKPKNLIELTKEVWQPYYDQELSENNAVEIIDNATAYISLLIKWDKLEKENQSCKINVLNKKENEENGRRTKNNT
jgi:allophanate hydrolase subunit 1